MIVCCSQRGCDGAKIFSHGMLLVWRRRGHIHAVRCTPFVSVIWAWINRICLVKWPWQILNFISKFNLVEGNPVTKHRCYQPQGSLDLAYLNSTVEIHNHFQAIRMLDCFGKDWGVIVCCTGTSVLSLTSREKPAKTKTNVQHYSFSNLKGTKCITAQFRMQIKECKRGIHHRSQFHCCSLRWEQPASVSAGVLNLLAIL